MSKSLESELDISLCSISWEEKLLSAVNSLRVLDGRSLPRISGAVYYNSVDVRDVFGIIITELDGDQQQNAINFLTLTE